MIILVDAMGGDNAPDAVIKGAVKAVNEVESEIMLIGDREVINSRVKELFGKEKIEDLKGVQREIDFSPDTFGHNANVPELDAFGGVKYMYHCHKFIFVVSYHLRKT